MKSIVMKYLLVLIIMLGLKVSQAQDRVFFIEIGENQLLYRNIENTVTINSNLPVEEYTIVFKYCDSVRPIIPNQQFSLVPGKGRFIEIDITDSKDSSKVFYTKQLKIEYLPNPELYYGISISGSKIDALTGYLFAKYPPSYNLLKLNHSFEITSWKIIIGDNIFEGEGKTISEEVKNELANNKNIEFLSLLAIVKGPDGIARKIGGVYNIH